MNYAVPFLNPSCVGCNYRTRAIITRSWFVTTLDYKPRILDPKIEEFPCLVHKLFATLSALQYKPQKNWVKNIQPRVIMALVRHFISIMFIVEIFLWLLFIKVSWHLTFFQLKINCSLADNSIKKILNNGKIKEIWAILLEID